MVLIQFHRQSRKDGNYQQAEWEKQVGENVGKICQPSWIHMTTSVPIVAGCTIRKRTWTSRHTSANKRWNNRLLFHQFISTLFNYLSPPSPGFHCLIFINPLETKHTHTHRKGKNQARVFLLVEDKAYIRTFTLPVFAFTLLQTFLANPKKGQL